MLRFRKILCPVDFFPPSRRAFQCALGLAAKFRGGIHVLHAIPPIITAAYGANISAAEITSDLEKEAERQVQQLRGEGEAKKIPVTTEVRVGDIDSQIRRAIKLKHPDLVIMGTHGRRGLDRWVIGSVTERMIRHCPVPLLERALIGSTAERVVRAVSNSCPILLIPPTGSRHGRTQKA